MVAVTDTEPPLPEQDPLKGKEEAFEAWMTERAVGLAMAMVGRAIEMASLVPVEPFADALMVQLPERKRVKGQDLEP